MEKFGAVDNFVEKIKANKLTTVDIEQAQKAIQAIRDNSTHIVSQEAMFEELNKIMGNLKPAKREVLQSLIEEGKGN